jgi:integration host factor subunit alpha
MTKADIVENVYAATGFSKKESIEIVEQIFQILKSTLVAGDNIKITGFGNFIVKEKNDRRGRNPQTGEEITIVGSQGVDVQAQCGAQGCHQRGVCDRPEPVKSFV